MATSLGFVDAPMALEHRLKKGNIGSPENLLYQETNKCDTMSAMDLFMYLCHRFTDARKVKHMVDPQSQRTDSIVCYPFDTIYLVGNVINCSLS